MALVKRIAHLERIVERQTVRMNSMIREGTVTDVDYDKGLAIVDAHGVETKPTPWLEPANSDYTDWTPMAKNQRVMVFSPGGDLARAFILPGGYTDQAAQPHQKQGERFTKFGDTTFKQTSSGLFINAGGTEFSFTAAGFYQTGGRQDHDGKNVGSTHGHESAPPGDPGPPLP
jgi:phage baseplate assembly protein V